MAELKVAVEELLAALRAVRSAAVKLERLADEDEALKDTDVPEVLGFIAESADEDEDFVQESFAELRGEAGHG